MRSDWPLCPLNPVQSGLIQLFLTWKLTSTELNVTVPKKVEELCLGSPFNSAFTLSYPRHADSFWKQNPSGFPGPLLFCFCSSMSEEEDRTALFSQTTSKVFLFIPSIHRELPARICFQLLLHNSWVSLIHQKNPYSFSLVNSAFLLSILSLCFNSLTRGLFLHYLTPQPR